ncbi:hypothetical protein DXB92_01435 [Ruminococcus sp. OM06-36AC]|nr:hypothetical protein DXB92_01435 [Ruminococcus sp. OM06-36AC]
MGCSTSFSSTCTNRTEPPQTAKSFLQIVFTFFVNHAILIEAAPHRFRMPVLHGAAGRTVPLQ